MSKLPCVAILCLFMTFWSAYAQQIPLGTDLTTLLAGQVTVQQSTNYGTATGAQKAVDGNPNTYALTDLTTLNNWWSLQLPDDYTLSSVEITARADFGAARLLHPLLTVRNGQGSKTFRTVLSNPGLGQKLRLYLPPGTQGRSITISLEQGASNGNNDKAIQLAEVKLFGGSAGTTAHIDVAPLGISSQKTSYSGMPANFATDGDRKTTSRTDDVTTDNWWRVDLPTEYEVRYLHVGNRFDCCAARLDNLELKLYDSNGVEKFAGTLSNPGQGSMLAIALPEGVMAKTVKIGLENGENNGEGNKIVSLGEVAVYTPMVNGLGDADGDGLSNEYEVANGLRAGDARDAHYDPDGNGHSNSFEFSSALPPAQDGYIQGWWEWDVWTAVTGNTLNDFFGHIASRSAPSFRSAVATSEGPTNWSDNYASRLRGWIVIPTAGNYRFAISGDNTAELWVGGNEFAKQEIAYTSGWTAPRNWDLAVSQKSSAISLAQGQLVYVEALQKEGNGSDCLSVGWSRDGESFAVIPAEHLRLPKVNVEDVNSNGLPDAWELEKGLPQEPNLAGGEWGDPDADGLTNLMEFQQGTNPFTSDGPQGKMSRQVWLGLSGSPEISALVRSGKYRAAPDVVGTTNGAEAPANYADAYGQRLRATVAAPVSGEYEFWIAGDGDVELWLSSDDRKFTKKLIAYVHGGYTSPREWDKYPSQRSVPVQLVAGKRYYIEALHVEGSLNDHVSIGWKTPGGNREVIPATMLRPFLGDMADLDDDYLPDAWEAAAGIVATDNGINDFNNGELGDPDGDFISNIQEYQNGTLPNQPNSIDGKVSTELWIGMPGYGVGNLVADRHFYEKADEFSLRAPAELRFDGTYFGTRSRGYLLPTQSGSYRFWISTKTAAELWISTDLGKGKYAKRRIARMDPEIGTGHGISYLSTNLWDAYASQMSEPITLQAGQAYYLEILHKAGPATEVHTSLAWAKVGEQRVALSSEFVRSFVRTSDDKDDDCLPDLWESQNGLSVSDNGAVNLGIEGDRGDFDHDGLSNLEEYLAGTNPSAVDTDADGETDYNELRTLGTNPLVSDSRLAGVVHHIGVPAFYRADGNVGMPNVNSASNTFRGRIAWKFNVPTPGYWIVAVKSTILGNVSSQEEVDIETAIDGSLANRQTVRYGGTHKAEFLTITPWLDAGVHDLELHIDNYLARRMVQIDAIQITTPGGLDADNDGLPDWLSVEFVKHNFVKDHPLTSTVSPLCIEGFSQIRAQTTVNGAVVTPGSDRNHWYYDLALEPSGSATHYSTVFDNTMERQGTVQWTPTNVLSGGTVLVRLGDSLRLGAWVDGSSGSAVISGAGMVTRQLQAGETWVRQFTQAGTFLVNAVHSEGGSATLNVKVAKAVIQDGKNVLQNVVSYWTVSDSQIDRTLWFDGGDSLEVGEIEGLTPSSFRLPLKPKWGGDCAIVARLWDDGPILDTGRLNAIAVTDALQNENTNVTSVGVPEGYRLVTAPTVIVGLPANGYVKVTITRAGVTFLDGTTVKFFYESDLANGVLMLKFLYPDSLSGGYCHYMDVYNASGALIGRR